jgi:hypothetical protein
MLDAKLGDMIVDKDSILDVQREARSISRRTFRGSRKIIYQKEKHVVNAAEAIRSRFGIGVKEWRAKHLRWFFVEFLKEHSSGTRYRYYRYLRQILIFMNRFDDFSPFLKGSWQFPNQPTPKNIEDLKNEITSSNS